MRIMDITLRRHVYQNYLRRVRIFTHLANIDLFIPVSWWYTSMIDGYGSLVSPLLTIIFYKLFCVIS